jgi:hypothetical protein
LHEAGADSNEGERRSDVGQNGPFLRQNCPLLRQIIAKFRLALGAGWI